MNKLHYAIYIPNEFVDEPWESGETADWPIDKEAVAWTVLRKHWDDLAGTGIGDCVLSLYEDDHEGTHLVGSYHFVIRARCIAHKNTESAMEDCSRDLQKKMNLIDP